MKTFINRALFQFGVGIFFGSALASADAIGSILMMAGVIVGMVLYSK